MNPEFDPNPAHVISPPQCHKTTQIKYEQYMCVYHMA